MSDGMSDARDYGPSLSKHGPPIVSKEGQPIKGHDCIYCGGPAGINTVERPEGPMHYSRISCAEFLKSEVTRINLQNEALVETCKTVRRQIEDFGNLSDSEIVKLLSAAIDGCAVNRKDEASQ